MTSNRGLNIPVFVVIVVLVGFFLHEYSMDKSETSEKKRGEKNGLHSNVKAVQCTAGCSTTCCFCLHISCTVRAAQNAFIHSLSACLTNMKRNLSLQSLNRS